VTPTLQPQLQLQHSLAKSACQNFNDTLNCCMILDSVIGTTFFSRSRFYLVPLSGSGGRMESEQCFFPCCSGHFHTWAIPFTPLGRVHIFICARFCSACRLHLFVTRLDWIQLSSSSIRNLWAFFSSAPLWLNAQKEYNLFTRKFPKL